MTIRHLLVLACLLGVAMALAAPAVSDPPAEQRVAGSSAPRVAIITLGDPTVGDTIGFHITAEALGRSIDTIDAMPFDDRPDTVILRIHSGGGRLGDGFEIADLIRSRLTPNYRTVAWIESAINAAVVPLVACEEVVVMPHAHFGGATSWPPPWKRDLRGLHLIEAAIARLTRRTGWPTPVVRAFFRPVDLSVSVDSATGAVTWRQDLDGEALLCFADPAQRRNTLVLNAADATRYRLARGIANDHDELAVVLGIAPFEVVCPQADAIQVEHRATMTENERELRALAVKYHAAIGVAEAVVDPRERERWVGQAGAILKRIHRIVTESPELGSLNDLGIRLDTIFEDYKAVRERLLGERNEPKEPEE